MISTKIRNTKTKVEFAIEVNGKLYPVENREAARERKRVNKASGIEAKIIRNEYQLVSTAVVR